MKKNQKLRGQLVAISTLLFVAATAAWAEDSTQTNATPAAENAVPATRSEQKIVVQLPTTVVVATRSEQPVADVAPSVSVVSGTDLRAAGTHSLGNALNTQVGVYSAGTTSTGTPTSLRIRGQEPDSTVIMLDGRFLNIGMEGNYGLRNLSLDNIDSMQILRGSASTLYGSSAMGGAIDLRTKNALDLAPNSSTGTLAIEGGSWGTRTTRAEFAGTQDLGNAVRAGISAGVSYSASDGYNWNNWYEKTNFTPRFDLEINEKIHFDVLAMVFENRYGIPGSETWKSDTDWTRERGYLVSPELAIDFTESLRGKILYSYSETETDGYSWGDIDTDCQQQQLSAQIDWQALEQVQVSLGIDSVYTNAFSIGSPSATMTDQSDAVWALARAKPIDSLVISAGTRYTHSDEYGARWTYELAAQYEIEPIGLTIFGKIATGFRTPNYYDLCLNYANWGYYVDDGLEAEKSISYEIGARERLFDNKLTLSATFFQIDTRDKIAYESNYPTWQTKVYNIDKARSRGVELEAELLLTDEIRIFGNLTYQSAWDRSTGECLSKVPRVLANFGAEINFTEDYLLGASATYVRGRLENGVSMDDYFVARVYGRAVLSRWADGNEQISAFGRIENLFNEHYDDYGIGYEAPHIGAFAGMQFSF